MSQSATAPVDPDASGWFGRRTSRAADHPLDRVARLREHSGTSVSVVLPALDEAATVGAVVECVAALRPLMVDEVLVVDGGSRDGTVAAAEEAGASVASQEELPPGGPPRGKGDALWRGLAATSGDLVVFADTDVRNPQPDLVPALLGPLLTDPRVALVKGCYDRPLDHDDPTRLPEPGGGRVTELLARPLLNLWWPSLAGVAQPLAGEYAARRSVLETLPFASGYGVELGLLIDVAQRWGAEAVAQVDLGVRIHTHQPLEALSRMAYGIAQVAARRLAITADAAAVADVAASYLQVLRDGDGRLALTAREVDVDECQPLRADVAQGSTGSRLG